MAAVEIVPFHNINQHNMDFSAKKQSFEKVPVAPFSPDGADLAPPTPTPTAKETTSSFVSSNITLEVQPATQHKSRMERKILHEESRKASIRRLASRSFEKQTGKQWVEEGMSPKEWEIYNEEVKKSEAVLDRKKAEDEAAEILASNIKFNENLLQKLTEELAQKSKTYQIGQDELLTITKDFEDAVKTQIASLPQPSSGVKSSSVRMQEEQQKKALKQAWRNTTSDDPVTKARQRQFASLEDINQLKIRIEEARKELGRMLGQSQKAKSSSLRMREEKGKKEILIRSGAVSTQPDAPIKVYVKREPEQRSHQQRMLDEQQRKAELRKQQRASVDVEDMVGRPRSGTTPF